MVIKGWLRFEKTLIIKKKNISYAYLSHSCYLAWLIIFILLVFVRRNWSHKMFDKAVIYSQGLNSQSREFRY